MSLEKELDYNDLLSIARKLSDCMVEKKSTINENYLQRVNYMLIKIKQLMIMDQKISKFSELHKQNQELKSEDIDEFHLFTEMFFYTASKLIDLFFEGLSAIHGIKKKPERCRKILEIRNNLIEHSHRRNSPLADEFCIFGFSPTHGPYLKPSISRKTEEVTYIFLKRALIIEMTGQINKALEELGDGSLEFA